MLFFNFLIPLFLPILYVPILFLYSFVTPSYSIYPLIFIDSNILFDVYNIIIVQGV